jgi:hypothetical protein
MLNFSSSTGLIDSVHCDSSSLVFRNAKIGDQPTPSYIQPAAYIHNIVPWSFTYVVSPILLLGNANGMNNGADIIRIIFA